jgi:hypothetical protein
VGKQATNLLLFSFFANHALSFGLGSDFFQSLAIELFEAFNQPSIIFNEWFISFIFDEVLLSPAAPYSSATSYMLAFWLYPHLVQARESKQVYIQAD